ncbi:MAG: 16S rRNA (cytidine(1402)-2'-O)-methyltransferase [Actinomycetaceae bacterium]|nr:16S rRNA (cytidine(1402)-2'-O)-methyltransferase [Actinomycetaceae bacterium]
MENASGTILRRGTLYLAATPIGDTRDASARLIGALHEADIIAAEDTRKLHSLLARLDCQPSGKILSLHDHNEGQRAQGLIRAAEDGARILIVSDAGMPTVSDPGYRAVTLAVEAGIPVSAIPGPSAPLAALAVSGLPSDRFSFEGFLPRKDGEAQRFLSALSTDTHTLIFFESPKRLHHTLARMAEVFGTDRRGAVCRELTKTHEEIIRGTLGELVATTKGEIRGEITIVIEGFRGQIQAADYVDAVLHLADEGMRLKDAAKEVAHTTGARANDLYTEALQRKNA